MPSPFQAAFKRLGGTLGPGKKDEGGLNPSHQNKDTVAQATSSASSIFGPYSEGSVHLSSSTSEAVGDDTPPATPVPPLENNQRDTDTSNDLALPTTVMPGKSHRSQSGRARKTRRTPSRNPAPGNNMNHPIDVDALLKYREKAMNMLWGDDDDEDIAWGPSTSRNSNNPLSNSTKPAWFNSEPPPGLNIMPPKGSFANPAGNTHFALSAQVEEPLSSDWSTAGTAPAQLSHQVLPQISSADNDTRVPNGSSSNAKKTDFAFPKPHTMSGMTKHDYEMHDFEDWDENEHEEDLYSYGQSQLAVAGRKRRLHWQSSSNGNYDSKLGGAAMYIDPPNKPPVPFPDISNEGEEDESEIPADKKAIIMQLKRYSRAMSISCAGCNSKQKLQQADIPKMTRKWATSTSPVLCGIQCSGNGYCTTVTCPGCNKAVVADNSLNPPRSVAATIAGKPLVISFCCGLGGSFAWWALTCGWDLPQRPSASVKQAVAEEFAPRRSNRIQLAIKKSTELLRGHKKEIAPPTIQADGLNSVPKAKTLTENRPRGTAKATAKGTGYGGDMPATVFSVTSKLSPYRKGAIAYVPFPVDSDQDCLHEAYFRILSTLISSIKMQDAGAGLSFNAMLERSPLIVKAAALLSNDSLQDIPKQLTLYEALLDFMEALTNLDTTAQLIYDDRRIFTKSGLTLAVSFGQDARKKITAKDTGKSLAYLLARLAIQGRTMLLHAAQNPEAFAEESEAGFVALTHRIVRLSSIHDDKLRQNQEGEMEIDSGKGKKPETCGWLQFHQKYAVDQLEDEDVLRDHRFAGRAEKTSGLKPAPGRMKRLINEISTLQTSLPDGIFIRYGSSRLDVMKILIVGPRGTPYEYGFFEFDLFCELEYPAIPPLMHFKTTGGGKVRFNPNLYPDGKVCLSLLGTWSGPNWEPEHSTILQLLVSVQSMIFCEDPYYNEPGFEGRRYPVEAAKYNNETRISTVYCAIQPWVTAIHAANDERQASAVNPAWGAIVQTHLRCFAVQIDRAFKDASSMSMSKGQRESGRLDVATIKLHQELKKQGYLT